MSHSKIFTEYSVIFIQNTANNVNNTQNAR